MCVCTYIYIYIYMDDNGFYIMFQNIYIEYIVGKVQI